jgi:hypothetical protein
MIASGSIGAIALAATEAASSSSPQYEYYLPTHYATNLLGYWHLAADANDDSGNGRNGTLVGTAPTYGQTGIPGSALGAARFNAGGYRMETRPASTPNPPLGANPFTVVAWVKRLGAGTVISSGSGGYADMEPVVCKGMAQSESATLNANYMLGVRNLTSMKVCADMEEHSTGSTMGLNHPVTGHDTLTDNEWHMIGVTFSVSGGWKLFLDGVDQTLDHGTQNPGQPPDYDSQLPFCIGGAMTSTADTWNGRFNGDICHVAVWETVLAPSDIQNLYNVGKPATPTAALDTTNPTLPTADIVIQLSDPAGSGIDDTTVSGADVKLWQDGTLLVENVDYTVAYNSTTDQITLTCSGGNWPVASYQIRINEGQ